jgi:hypothetical protein
MTVAAATAGRARLCYMYIHRCVIGREDRVSHETGERRDRDEGEGLPRIDNGRGGHGELPIPHYKRTYLFIYKI